MPEATPSRRVQELEVNLDRETTLYETLADIARKLALALEHHDLDALTELLERKKSVIAELMPVAETTRRLRRELAEQREVPADVQARASGALERARGALEVLLGLERANEESLQAATSSMREDLIEVARGRRLLEGYRGTRETEPLFMDKRR